MKLSCSIYFRVDNSINFSLTQTKPNICHISFTYNVDVEKMLQNDHDSLSLKVMHNEK